MKDERDPRTYAIIGAAMDVHKELGCGFLEPVYHEALLIEFAARGIPFRHEIELPIYYKGTKLNTTYRADFVCYEDRLAVIVEVKALSQITGTEEAQIINYLKATKCETGLLINFGAAHLHYQRFVLTASI